MAAQLENWINRVSSTWLLVLETGNYENFYEALDEAIRRVKVPGIFYEDVRAAACAHYWMERH